MSLLYYSGSSFCKHTHFLTVLIVSFFLFTLDVLHYLSNVSIDAVVEVFHHALSQLRLRLLTVYRVGCLALTPSVFDNKRPATQLPSWMISC